MKKLSKAFALFAAVAMLGTGFFSCSSDDSGSSGPAKASGEKLVETRVSVNTEAAAGTVTLDGVTKESIAAALAAITDSANHVIELTEGTYKEDGLRYQGGANITIKGPATDNPYGAKVLILGKGANMDSEGGNQAGRELLEIAGSGNVILENIALWNNFTKDGDCQAEAFGFDSTGTAAAYNCSFISRQDTTRTTGKAWFYKCYVEGDVDFLWMESSGKVALYEECRLRAVTGRKKADKQVDAFFTAPRVNVVDEATYGKGLVIFNSKVEVEDGLTTYLFRNPWGNNSAYYNNVAVVDSTLYGAVVKEPLWKNAPMYDRLNPCGGFLTNMAGLSNMDASLVSKEYTGRNNILNRVYDSETNSMHKDFANEWSLSALETEFNATADTSASLLPGEKELKMVEVNFNAYADPSVSDWTSADGNIVAHTTAIREDQRGHGFVMTKGNSLTLKNLPKYCKVTILGCAYGSAKCTVTGPEGFNTINPFEVVKVPTADGGPAGSFVYGLGVEGDVTITLNEDSPAAYFHGVSIREYESLTPATGITITAPKTTISVDEAVQLSATIAPADVTLKAQKWTSSDPATVLISDKGLIQGLKAGTATITVATKDGTDLTDTVDITVAEKTAKPVAGKSYSWNMQGGVGNPYFSSDMLFQCFGDSDNGSHGLVIKTNSYAKIDVAGNVKVTLHRCRYDNGGTCTVTDKAGNTVATVIFPEGAGGGVADTATLDFAYIGPETTLKLTWSNGTGSCYLHQVDVAPLGTVKSVTSIAVTAAEDATTLDMGDTLQMTATVTPVDATVTAVDWSSSDTSKATVDVNGVVTAVAAGDVTITAKAKDGSNVTGTYDLTINTKAVTVTWDFHNITTSVASGVELTGNQVVTDGTSGIGLLVDVGSGKFWQRASGDLQLGAGTKIYVPVSVGSVVSYTGNWKTDCKVDGESQNEATSFTSEPATEAGYVEIEALSGNCYFFTISVTNILPSDYIAEEIVYDFNNMNTNLASGDTIQNASGDISVGTSQVKLYVDATSSGKFWQRSSGDAQLAAGTKVYIPVSAGSVVSYTGNWKTDCYIDGEDQNESTSYTGTAATAAGYVVLEAKSNNCYLYSIKVTNVKAIEWRQIGD